MRRARDRIVTKCGAWSALVIGACSSKSDPPPAPMPPPPSEPSTPPPARDDAMPTPDDATPAGDIAQPTVRGRTVRWSNVTRTDGCFFFSGPDGRDDQLVGDVVVETVEREGERLRLRIGTAVFDGTYANGELSLVRKSEYDYDGPWRTTESIRGTLVDGGIQATYDYEECELARPETCPGRCRVHGTLTFARGL